MLRQLLIPIIKAPETLSAGSQLLCAEKTARHPLTNETFEVLRHRICANCLNSNWRAVFCLLAGVAYILH